MRIADAREKVDCPKCGAPAGSPCVDAMPSWKVDEHGGRVIDDEHAGIHLSRLDDGPESDHR